MITGEGGQASAAKVDATDEGSVRALVSDVATQHGSLDILHNNVGASIALGGVDPRLEGDRQLRVHGHDLRHGDDDQLVLGRDPERRPGSGRSRT